MLLNATLVAMGRRKSTLNSIIQVWEQSKRLRRIQSFPGRNSNLSLSIEINHFPSSASRKSVWELLHACQLHHASLPLQGSTYKGVLSREARGKRERKGGVAGQNIGPITRALFRAIKDEEEGCSNLKIWEARAAGRFSRTSSNYEGAAMPVALLFLRAAFVNKRSAQSAGAERSGEERRGEEDAKARRCRGGRGRGEKRAGQSIRWYRDHRTVAPRSLHLNGSAARERDRLIALGPLGSRSARAGASEQRCESQRIPSGSIAVGGRGVLTGSAPPAAPQLARGSRCSTARTTPVAPRRCLPIRHRRRRRRRRQRYTLPLPWSCTRGSWKPDGDGGGPRSYSAPRPSRALLRNAPALFKNLRELSGRN